MRVYYFGCWNQAGHYMFGPHGGFVHSSEYRALECYGADRRHIDGTLAPRRGRDGKIFWAGQLKGHRWPEGAECPQGQCLVHQLDNGFTYMQWWDRNQGDKRGACNSTVLLEGKHDFETMVRALRAHFPTVAANLDKAGIKLVEVKVE